MNMSLEMDNAIYIKGFKNEEPDFYCWQHMKDLIGFPTRVFLVRNDTIYVTHPTLDVVPLSDNCVDYKVLKDVDLGYHRGLKDKLNMMKQMGVNRVPIEKIKKIFKPKLDEQEEPKKSSRDETILELINQLNNNELDFEFLDNFMGGLDNFINIVSKKGWLHLIDPFSEATSEIQNSLFYAFSKTDPQFIYTLAEEFFSDIEKVGNDYYFSGDYSQIADLFSTGRNDISEKTIAEIISGNYDPYSFGGYDTDDTYRDVYDNLDQYGKSVVDEYIVNELKAMGTLSLSIYKRPPLTMKDISEEQGTEGKIELTDEVIVRLMNDDECLEYLINKELDDVGSNLNSVYSTCYGDILYDEWYNTLWGEIEGEVVDDKQGEEYSYEKAVWLKDGTRGKKMEYGKRFKVTKCLYNALKGWLEVNKNKNNLYDNTLGHFGGYIEMLKDAMEYGPMDRLRVPRLDDYPDWRKMNKCINDNVEGYF
jgi:hypothetical protein